MPWHNQEHKEVYSIVQGEGEFCVGTERSPIKAGYAVFMPPTLFHQLTKTCDERMHMIYIYRPGGDVAHLRQELNGTLPKAGEGAIPPAPRGCAAAVDVVARGRRRYDAEIGFSAEPWPRNAAAKRVWPCVARFATWG